MKKKHVLTLVFAGLFLIIVVVALFVKNTTPFDEEDFQQPKDTAVFINTPAPELFGIQTDTFEIVKEEVKAGDSFGKLVGAQGLGTQSIYTVASSINDVFDVRKIKAGRKYAILKGANSAVPAYFIYEESLLNYYVVSLKDSVYAIAGHREKTIKVKEIGGVINSSLSQTLNNNALTDKLSSIYAWSIDFFRIQKGDSVAVIFEDIFVDDTIHVGIGKVIAARFDHYGSTFYAFRYTDKSGATEYYNETGKSLRKAFLKAPLEFSRISSRFTMKRFHPVQKRWKAHLGTDYAAPSGTPIMTTSDGYVEKAGYTSGNGNYVKVKHNSVYSTQYLHMSKIAKGMSAGKHVRQGEVIGYVGSTGLATGPHVCYRFWKNGKQVDPFSEKLPDANPIKDEYKADFLKHIEQYLAELKN